MAERVHQGVGAVTTSKRSGRINSIYGMREFRRSYGTPYGHIHIRMESPFEFVLVDHTSDFLGQDLIESYRLERFGPHDETELLKYVLDRAEETVSDANQV